MKILFVCTANSCRSILSEAIFNSVAPDGMQAFSAGSHPSGSIHPQSLKALKREGIIAEELFSKSIEIHRFLDPDFVITVCDKAAAEACPIVFSTAIKAHWGLADPSDINGSPDQIKDAFDATLAHIKKRVNLFMAISHKQLNREQLMAEIALIGCL
ncbi:MULTISPECIES: arsenate reductase ArsC [Pseudomonas]|jgi:arsenate reductase (thioredoxin)|uniref:Arsenate reductase ArsC n=2 Tax=Pseudomonas TaxID=286 RepID=A0A7X1L0A5_9PSED|nr:MULTISPECIES: arsenate reductase ArsC [Pseudomonas]MBC2693473.1 arsenate reductase ArsC [Pseudomonas kielensis]MDD1010282.1 arsenate reductase ArsC [Pseudomonas shahriarae]MDZ4324083.1 arsenate reductase ArsC [Pseudomonas sp.]